MCTLDKIVNLLAVKGVLGVEHGEHSLVKLGEKFSKSFFQINVSKLIIGLKVFEEVGEDIRVPFVDNSVGFLEHEVEISL